jgi:hypothetical protein
MLEFLFLCLLWGIYAARRQLKIHGWSSGWARSRVIVISLINFVFCPFCMILAIVRGE